MADDKRLNAVADVLSDEGNVGLSAGEVAQRVLDALEVQRKRAYRYLIVAQDRSKPLPNGRAFHPTWSKGPYYTLPEARAAARGERKVTGYKVMVVQCFEASATVDPESLSEVLG